MLKFLFLSPGEGSSFLSFRKGDLIILEQENGEAVMNSGWCFGLCDRSGKQGDFPAECVYVLPTITKPPTDILVSLILTLCEKLLFFFVSVLRHYLLSCFFSTVGLNKLLHNLA